MQDKFTVIESICDKDSFHHRLLEHLRKQITEKLVAEELKKFERL